MHLTPLPNCRGSFINAVYLPVSEPSLVDICGIKNLSRVFVHSLSYILNLKVFFKSCKDERAFILTEYPSSDSVVDFLRLIKDHEADYIIFMNPSDDVMKVHV